jgi:uncharacterized protein (TIGR02996 family)
MRTFLKKGARSSTFWTIAREGNTLTQTSGTVGGKEKVQAQEHPDENRLWEKYDKLLGQKLAQGYVETTPGASRPPLGPVGAALEQAVVDNPADLASHMALGDWLAEQPDPDLQAKGEFIRTHLALEEGKSAAQRKKLRAREQALWQTHERAWLGPELAVYALDNRADELPYYFGPSDAITGRSGRRLAFSFARGWVDVLVVGYLSEALAKVLAPWDGLRLVRELEVEEVDDMLGEPFAVLGEGGRLANLKVLRVRGRQGGGNPENLVRHLPRVEEIYLKASSSYPSGVFGLKNLHHLRVLTVDGAASLDLGPLASNRSLGSLTFLSLHPHAVEDKEEGAPIKLPEVRALVRSRHLKSLTHLAIHITDAGDRGCKAIVESGILKRLKALALVSGTITDKGARLLADCPDLKNLETLDLSQNWLTREGIRALKATGVKMRAEWQHEEGDDQYLYEGDCE